MDESAQTVIHHVQACLVPSWVGTDLAADEPAGAQLYRKHCATCHDAGTSARVPALAALKQKTTGSIMKALESGVMRQQGAVLGRAERIAVSAWLGKTEAAAVAAGRLANRCAATAGLLPSSSGTWSNWGAGPSLPGKHLLR